MGSLDRGASSDRGALRKTGYLWTLYADVVATRLMSEHCGSPCGAGWGLDFNEASSCQIDQAMKCIGAASGMLPAISTGVRASNAPAMASDLAYDAFMALPDDARAPIPWTDGRLYTIKTAGLARCPTSL